MRETTLSILGRRVADWRRDATIILVAGSLLAFLSPFGSAGFGWPGVWFYWVGLIAVGSVCTTASVTLVRRLNPPLRPVLLNVLDGLIASVPITIVVVTVNGMLTDIAPTVWLWPTTFVPVAVITAAMITVGELVERARAAQPVTRAPPRRRPLAGETAASPRSSTDHMFKDRLPQRLRHGELLAITSEDHYLRVFTTHGDDLVLMRLADAERELAEADGMRVHRSWWVARAAVEHVQRIDGKLRLHLSNGVTAPVSRTYAPALREAGWTQNVQPAQNSELKRDNAGV